VKATKWAESETHSSRRWNHFPNSVVARYFQLRTAIELSEIDSKTFMLASGSNDLAIKRKVLPVLMHELRHWFDHIGSVWGQKDLMLALDALQARMSNDPNQLWKINQYLRAAQQDRYEDYYSIIENPQPPPNYNKLWKWQLSCGARFDRDGRLDESLPILFTRFAWPDDSPACRVPFSVASLLEASAMSTEWTTEAALIMMMGKPASDTQGQVLAAKSLDYLYDPTVAEYSVAAHLVANRFKLSDPLTAFKFASYLSSVCLNLLDEHFGLLKIPDSFHPWSQRIQAFIKRRDRGFAYAVLAHHAPSPDQMKDMEWINNTLTKSGLPPLPVLQELAIKRMKKVREEAAIGPLRSHRLYLLDLGVKFVEKVGIIPFVADFDISAVPLPPVVLSDMTVAYQGQIEPWDNSPVSQWLDQVTKLESALTEFVDACGV
jgi:hypothetical protein